MKIIYIAHPISGDIAGNLEKIRLIVRKINLCYNDVVPMAPYWLDCHALDDKIPEERERGIKNDIAVLESGLIQEVWLYGNRISTGMQHEIDLAVRLGIRVVAKSEEILTTLEKSKGYLFEYIQAYS